MSRKATAAQFKRVKIFLTDVDGVLTNATVMLNGKTEFKQFNIQDGMGLRLLQHVGIPVGWVTNRKSAATTARAKELKVDYLWQKSLPKVAAVETILKKAKLTWADACFMSDDINDRRCSSAWASHRSGQRADRCKNRGQIHHQSQGRGRGRAGGL